MSKLSEKVIHTFIKENSQLKFLCILIQEMPKTVLKKIFDGLSIWKNDQRIFIIDKFIDIQSTFIYIPIMYIYEIMKFKTQICVIDIFNYNW